MVAHSLRPELSRKQLRTGNVNVFWVSAEEPHPPVDSVTTKPIPSREVRTLVLTPLTVACDLRVVASVHFGVMSASIAVHTRGAVRNQIDWIKGCKRSAAAIRCIVVSCSTTISTTSRDGVAASNGQSGRTFVCGLERFGRLSGDQGRVAPFNKRCRPDINTSGNRTRLLVDQARAKARLHRSVDDEHLARIVSERARVTGCKRGQGSASIREIVEQRYGGGY